MRKLGIVMIGMILLSFASAGLVDFLSGSVEANVVVDGPVFYLTEIIDPQFNEDYVLNLNEQPEEGLVVVAYGKEINFVSQVLGIDEFYDEVITAHFNVLLERNSEEQWCDYFSGFCDEEDFSEFDIEIEKEEVCGIYNEFYRIDISEGDFSVETIIASPCPLGLWDIDWENHFDFEDFCEGGEGMIEFAVYVADENNAGQEKICEAIYNGLEMGENDLELECESYKGRRLRDLDPDEKIILKVRGTSNERSNLIKIRDSRIEVVPE